MSSKESRQQRIAAIRQQLMELEAELERLEEEGEDGPPRRKFTIIRGGLGALGLPAASLARRRVRAVRAGAALAAAGAVAGVVLGTLPTRSAPGASAPPSGPMMPAGSVTAVLPFPSAPSTGTSPTNVDSVVPSTTLPGAGDSVAPPIPVGTSLAPSGSPTAPSGIPSIPMAPPSNTTSSSAPAPSPSCLIEATVTGVLNVCVV